MMRSYFQAGICLDSQLWAQWSLAPSCVLFTHTSEADLCFFVCASDMILAFPPCLVMYLFSPLYRL